MKTTKTTKLQPTEKQIKRMQQIWDREKYDIAQQCPEKADAVQCLINQQKWDDVYDYLCNIGCDDAAEELKGPRG